MDRRTRILPWLLALLVLAAVWVVPARAGEDDAAALLGRARTAESVERDVAAAMDLYRQALDAPGSPDASRDAALALARLQEERGAVSEALATLVLATERFATRMDEATKRQVHEALVRLLPPGSTARSPLGQVVVVRADPGAAATSPLDEKIRNLLSTLEAADATSQHYIRQQIRQALAAVGKEALPALERILFGDRPARGALAAEMLAQIGGVDALPVLERAVREGDGFTRDAALGALDSVTRGEEEDRRVAEVADRLLAQSDDASARERLLAVLRRRLPPPALLERHRAGDGENLAWLAAALRAKAEGAFDRAVELAKAGGTPGRQALGILLPMIFPSDPKQQVYPPSSLDRATRRLFLDLLLEGRDGAQLMEPIALLLASLRDTEGPEAVASDLERAWRLAVAEAKPGNRSVHMAHLLARLPVPTALFRDLSWAKAWLEVVRSIQVPVQALVDSADFWNAFFEVFPSLPAPVQSVLLSELANHYAAKQTLPPPEYDRRWIPLLPAANEILPTRGFGYQFLLAAARSGDPAFLEAVRDNTVGWWSGSPAYLQALKDYQGPELLEFALGMLREPGLDAVALSYLFPILAERTGPEGQRAVLAIARDWSHPQALSALQRVGPAATDADLLDLARQVQAADPPASERYRSRLIGLFGARKLREAVPYLVWEYRSASELSEHAGKTLDAIRDYHEKIASFEAWAKGGPPPSATADLLGLLAREDPDVRRAAAIALGALRRKDALPALVKAGAEDPDERVRQAALEAVEKIGRE